MRLPFAFGGVTFFSAHLQALVLDAPFNHVTFDPSHASPPQPFPDGIEVTRICSCPLQPTKRTIALLPHAILYIPAQYEHLYIPIGGSFEQYLQKFSSKTRWTLRKKLKRLVDESGAAPFCEYSAAQGMAEFYSLARAVSQKTYQERLLDAGIPRAKDFPLELERLARTSGVRGYILMHQSLPMAYALCFAHGDTLTLDKTGYDPQYAHLNPGTVLTYLMIERLFQKQEFRVFDFGTGYYEYKALFSSGRVPCADIMYLRRTLRNFVLVFSHAGLDRASRIIKKGLAGLGIKSRVKKWIRRLA